MLNSERRYLYYGPMRSGTTYIELFGSTILMHLSLVGHSRRPDDLGCVVG
jgi:hypothetical protein